MFATQKVKLPCPEAVRSTPFPSPTEHYMMNHNFPATSSSSSSSPSSSSSFITWIFIAPLQGYYSEVLPTYRGQRRDLGHTVTGGSTIHHHATMNAFLHGLLPLLRRSTGPVSSSSTARDCSSAASRVCDRCWQLSLYPIDITW